MPRNHRLTVDGVKLRRGIGKRWHTMIDGTVFHFYQNDGNKRWCWRSPWKDWSSEVPTLREAIAEARASLKEKE